MSDPAGLTSEISPATICNVCSAGYGWPEVCKETLVEHSCGKFRAHHREWERLRNASVFFHRQIPIFSYSFQFLRHPHMAPPTHVRNTRRLLIRASDFARRLPTRSSSSHRDEHSVGNQGALLRVSFVMTNERRLSSPQTRLLVGGNS